MSLRRYSSVATETTLSAGITNASTGLTVVNPSGYPVVPFTVRIQDEAILVGGKSGNTFNVLTRGFDGTSAVAHSSGLTLNHVAIGDDFDHLWSEVALDRSFATYDDEFGAATIDAGWTEVTPTGTAVWTQSNGVMSVATEGQSSNDICAIVKPFPVLPPYTIETACRLFAVRSNYTMIGLVLSDGTSPTSNAVSTFFYTTATNGELLLSQRSGTFTAMSSNVSSVHVRTIGLWMYLRLIWKSINTFEIQGSSDGVSWAGLNLPDIAVTFTPTHAGVLFSSWGDSTPDSRVGSFEFFRTHV